MTICIGIPNVSPDLPRLTPQKRSRPLGFWRRPSRSPLLLQEPGPVCNMRPFIGLPLGLWPGFSHLAPSITVQPPGETATSSVRPPMLTRCSECWGVSDTRSSTCICFEDWRIIPFPLKRASPFARSQYNVPPSNPSTKRTARIG